MTALFDYLDAVDPWPLLVIVFAVLWLLTELELHRGGRRHRFGPSSDPLPLPHSPRPIDRIGPRPRPVAPPPPRTPPAVPPLELRDRRRQELLRQAMNALDRYGESRHLATAIRRELNEEAGA